MYQEGPTSNECQKVRTEDRGGKEVVFWAGLGKDHAHKGSEGSKPACPCALQNLLPYSLNFKPQCRMFYVSGKVLHISDNSKDYSGHCGLQLYDFLLA